MYTLYKTLDKKTKNRLIITVSYVIIMGFFEVFGIFSIVPYLSVLGDPELIETNRYLSFLKHKLKLYGIIDNHEFMLVLGLFSFVVIIFSSIIRIICNLKINNFIEMLRHEFSSKLFYYYLKKEYHFFLNRNTTEFSKIILSEIDQLVNLVVRPFITMFSSFFVLFSITIMLLLVNPTISLFSLLIISIIYVTIFLLLRKKVTSIGEARLDNNNLRFKFVSDAFSGLKMLKFYNLEDKFSQDFNVPSKRYAFSYATQQTINQLPNYLVEAIMFGSLVLISSYLISFTSALNKNLLGEILPLLGIYAFSAYRLKPSMQMIYQGFSSLRNGSALILQVSSEIINNTPHFNDSVEQEELSFKHKLSFSDVTYFYSGSAKATLNGINFSLDRKSSLGIVGTTGSGKSTIVNLFLGLLSPTSGSIFIDKTPLSSKNIKSWRCKIGYVPQEIYLSDKTIKENIAFGENYDNIDHKKIEECSRCAHIFDFITDELEHGFDTLVGERGIRLSGGQRQRIGIARALYNKPSILVFDEATSALDSKTESSIIESINRLSKNLTTVMITHRISTVKNCNQIIVLEKGKIKKIGSYDEINFDN